MNGRTLALLSSVAGVALALALWWLARPIAPVPMTVSNPLVGASPVPSMPAPASPAVASAPPVQRTPATMLDDIQARLEAANKADASREILADLRKSLEALPREAASREVQSFLALKKDAATRLDVTVKPGGALGDASSLRVFLLDYLGQIDRPAAAAVGKEILSTPISPDEWAVSLRNIAWADDSPDNLAYLRGRAREMIANADWRRQPSAGFLEAFDVIVHARGFDLTPQLAGLVRDKDNRAVAYAAYLTLDRLTLADPASALEPLSARPELMEGREQTRANFFARADVRDPQQRSLLEGYLLDPRHSTEELRTFAGLFPNANQMISSNLLTPTATPAAGELAAGDRAALQVVEAWLTDPRFAKLKPQFTATRDRLRSFVLQAAALANP